MSTEMSTAASRRLAALTYHSEVLCLLLTGVYTLVVFHDILGDPLGRVTSASWYEQGFCIWQADSWEPLNSHTLSFVADILLGGVLLLVNLAHLVKHQSEGHAQDVKRQSLILGVAGSGFNMLHGLGHLAIYIADSLGITLTDSVGMADRIAASAWPWLELLAIFLGLASFLAIAPVVGWFFGVPGRLAVSLHLAQVVLFMATVPQQFSFGAVQLVLNLWFCLPRVLWIGTTSTEDVAKRTPAAFVVGSVSMPLLMSVVFAEMLGCDTFYRAWGGHFLYDFSILSITLVSSAAVWRSSNSAGTAKKLE